MPLRLLVALSLLLVSSVSASAETRGLVDVKAQKAAVKCQKTIDQAGAKLVATKLKSIDACSTAVLTCLQVKPADATCLQKAKAKCAKAIGDAIPQAEVGATAKIVKSCGTPLRPADLLAGDGLGIGADAATCYGDFGLNVCSNLTALAQCLVATHGRGAERVFASEQPRASELIGQVLSPLPFADLPAFEGCQGCAQTPSDTLGKAVAACGAATTKAARTFAGALAKRLGGCIDKVFACVQTKPGDAKCLAKAATACDGAVEKLGAARTKLTKGVDKRCADTGQLPFATLAADAALNLDALADDCAALGVPALGSLGDYVTCVRRQHECRVAEVLRSALPRTAELVEAGLLGGAGELLDAAQCPASLPSEALRTRRAAARAFGTFSIARFFSMTKRFGAGPGVKATKVDASAPPSSPNGVRRVAFPLGVPNRFVPGTSQIVKVAYHGAPKAARPAGAAIINPAMLIVDVKRSDLVVEDHLEISLDDVPAGEDGTFDLQIDYDAAPPSCVFDVAFAVSEGGEVSDYTVVEEVSDTVPPPITTPAPVPTATPVATVAPTGTKTLTPTPTLTATATGLTPTRTATPTATGATPTATPSPVFAYALTATSDPVAPGRAATFTVTVTNLTNSVQTTNLSFIVPDYVTFASVYTPGETYNFGFSNVAAGTSRSAFITLNVHTDASAPPDGTPITLTVRDTARGVSVERTVVTQSAAAARAELALATAQGTVAPGGGVTYTLDYHNTSAAPLADVELSVPLPAGTSFVSADRGGVLGGDSVVRWAIGTLADGATGQVTVNLTASTLTKGPLLVEAALASAGDVAARASATTPVYALPTFAYALTATSDPVGPGQAATFLVTLTNLTNTTQSTSVSFRIPNFTSFASVYTPGESYTYNYNNVAAGASVSSLITLNVYDQANAPPDGTLINLTVVDGGRGAAVSRTVVARSTAAARAELELATTDGTVAPGGAFAYTLAFHNVGLSVLDSVELSVPLPAGTSFVGADGGGALGADGFVRWPIGALADGATGQVRLELSALATARGPLVVESTLRSGGEVVAEASAATAVYAAPTFSYALTAPSDPVAPGQAALFTVTVTNLTNSTQSTTLSFRVPDFATFASVYTPGETYTFNINNVAPGASVSSFITLDVHTGGGAPPDGTLINLSVADGARSAMVSRTVVARSPAAARADLELATNQGTVAPGGGCAYTLSFHNASPSPLDSVELSVPIPTGASFVGADGGGALGADGIVRWPIGALADGATGHVKLELSVLASAESPLLVEGTLRSGGDVVAQASATTAVYTAPTFSYALTSTSDPVAPGQAATFTATVTNLTNSTQSTSLSFRVPNFATFASVYTPGETYTVNVGNVAAGASVSTFITLNVHTGVGAPPDGTLINLAVVDGARGASVSRTVVTQSAAAARADLELATAEGTVAPGGAFAYTLAYHNPSPSPLADVELSVPVPAGASFVGADAGGVLGGDGIVRWPIGTVADGATGRVTLSLSALAGVKRPLLVEGILRSGADIVAQASATTAAYVLPAFSYELTTANDPIAPGQTATFTAKVTNLTNATRSTSLSFRVPNFAVFASVYTAGETYTLSFDNVAAGASASQSIPLKITSAAQAPPDGTLVNLTVTDGGLGASVSRTIVTDAP